MPAKAGIQPSFELTGIFSSWIPVFAGMTNFFRLHLPVVLNAQGKKLSKQTLAPALDLQKPQQTLRQALTCLQHAPPQALRHADIKELLEWAINNWSPAQLPRLRTIGQTNI